MIMSASNIYRRAALASLSGAALWCVAGLAWAQTAIPFKRDGSSAGSDVSRFGLGLLVSIAVLAAVLFWLRRKVRQIRPGKDGGSDLQICESRHLGPRSLLHVVHFAGQQYLIGQSEQGLVCLASSPLPVVPSSAETVSTNTYDQASTKGQGADHAQT